MAENFYPHLPEEMWIEILEKAVSEYWVTGFLEASSEVDMEALEILIDDFLHCIFDKNIRDLDDFLKLSLRDFKSMTPEDISFLRTMISNYIAYWHQTRGWRAVYAADVEAMRRLDLGIV
jgi:hypothetical protein